MKAWREIAPAVRAAVADRYPVQKQLAGKMGVSRAALSAWLLGTHTPLLESAMRLVDEAGLSWASLLDERSAPSVTIGGDDFVSVPLVAANVAAGHGAIPELPEDRRVYAFRRDYVRRAIGTGDPRDGMLVTVFLARDKSDAPRKNTRAPSRGLVGVFECPSRWLLSGSRVPASHHLLTLPEATRFVAGEPVRLEVWALSMH